MGVPGWASSAGMGATKAATILLVTLATTSAPSCCASNRSVVSKTRSTASLALLLLGCWAAWEELFLLPVSACTVIVRVIFSVSGLKWTAMAWSSRALLLALSIGTNWARSKVSDIRPPAG